MEDAYDELGLQKNGEVSDAPPHAKFSQKYYNDIARFATPFNEKKYDFCFIGSIQSAPERRDWVIDFAKKYFTNNSIFVNTDNDADWKLLGNFDKTRENKGFAPKKLPFPDNQSRNVQFREVNENEYYFKSMCESKFILCPAGDAPWSFRIYETMLCRSIPIVETVHHTYRSDEEAKLDYMYLLANDIDKIKDVMTNEKKYTEMVNANNAIFSEKHLIKPTA